MLAIQKRFNQLRRKVAFVLLAALVWIISLPTTSVQADGYYSEKSHKVEATPPYYSTKERRIAQSEHFKPYYTSKERHQKKVIRTQPQIGNDIESGRRAKEAIPRDLSSDRRY
ncbi:hypothetical protein A6770_05560 [Nostoc minutum NIES-26]|uniref:Uncharacterized protein n=1 Tax=Nostoc minutum NIES-26 TaxID=1844469 RepID=A0A367Q622_9NOSO|nr:hypothetical protein A6770_05560 [Nostoc minutum NIES-26]